MPLQLGFLTAMRVAQSLMFFWPWPRLDLGILVSGGAVGFWHPDWLFQPTTPTTPANQDVSTRQRLRIPRSRSYQGSTSPRGRARQDGAAAALGMALSLWQRYHVCKPAFNSMLLWYEMVCFWIYWRQLDMKHIVIFPNRKLQFCHFCTFMILDIQK